jgi:hypothetical protein
MATSWLKENEYRINRVNRLLLQSTLSNTNIPSEMLAEVKLLVDHLIYKVDSLEKELAGKQ